MYECTWKFLWEHYFLQVKIQAVHQFSNNKCLTFELIDILFSTQVNHKNITKIFNHIQCQISLGDVVIFISKERKALREYDQGVFVIKLYWM